MMRAIRGNAGGLAWFLSLTGLLASVPSDSAEHDSAESVAEAHQDQLQKPGLHSLGDYCFSVGTYQSTGTNDGALATTEEGATLVAFSHYLGAVLLLDEVPREIGPALKADVRSRAADMIIKRLRVSGIDEISEQADDDGNVRVVLAVRNDAIRSETRRWDGCVHLIRDSALAGDANDAALWAEILVAAGEDAGSAVGAWIKRLCRQPGVAATIHGTPSRVTDGWIKLPERIDPAKLSALPDERLFELLDRRPFDGDLIDAIRDRLTTARKGVMSRATRTWHRVAPAARPMAADRLTETLAAAELKAPDDVPGVAIVLRYVDTWPVSNEATASTDAVSLFRSGDLKSALRTLLRQFDSEPSADGANYIAACLLALDRTDAAEAWARVATAWNPAHPFAAVNLMRALERRGQIDEARKIAGTLPGKAQLDDWGKAEVARILAEPRKPGVGQSEEGAPP